MCKKITLIIAVVALLIGVQSLIAQERDADRPRESGLRSPARPTERQPVMREPVERGDIERGRRERAERGDQPRPEPPMGMEDTRRPAPPMAPAKTGPVQEDFGRWLDELTKAYRANDREKMGEIIRQMQQLRPQRQTPGRVVGKGGQDFDRGPKVEVEKVRPGTEKKAPKLVEKAPQPAKKSPQAWNWKDQQGGFPGGPAGWGRCPWCGCCPRCGAMAGQGMAFQQRGFGWQRPEGPPPPVMDKQAPPMAPKDVTGPEPLRMRRGMGGWQRPEGPPPAVMDKQAPPIAPKNITGPEPLRMRRGMGGWQRPEGPPPAVMDKQAPPIAPKDVTGPEPLRMRRGIMGGWWRPDVPGPEAPQPRPAEPRLD